MAIVRSIIGIIVGAVVIFTLVGGLDFLGAMIFNAMPDRETMAFPADANLDGYCAWNVIMYPVATCVGAFLAALIAGHRPMLHAGIIAGLVVCGGIAYCFVGPAVYEEYGAAIPGWYLPALPVTGAIGALLGGRLRGRRSAAAAGA